MIVFLDEVPLVYFVFAGSQISKLWAMPLNAEKVSSYAPQILQIDPVKYLIYSF